MSATSMRRRYLSWALRHMSLYPPYIAAGIRVPVSDPAGGVYRSEMKLSFYNRNALGTHFGGSLYAMCDPFYALILIEQLGPGYAVWDKSSLIEFRRPGRGRVSATFQIPPDEVSNIKEAADTGEVVEPVFIAEVTDESDRVIARVTKTLHVKRKNLEG